jgi:aminoglycoside 6'-N-acetyltransferase
MKKKVGKITFRPLRESDLPLMHKWFNTPHVSEWWSLDGNHHPSSEEVTKKYSPRIRNKEPVDCYLFYYDNRPIGMIQSCDLDNYPAEKAAFGLEGKCTGIDLLIGEEDYVHKGLGSGIMRSFLKDIVFAQPDVECCIADPYEENTIAIKAYQKAGFKYLRTVWYEADQKKEDLYTIRRDEIIP